MWDKPELLPSIERNFGDPVIGYEADGTAVKASVAKAQFAEDLSKPEEFMTVEDFERELVQCNINFVAFSAASFGG